MRERPEVILKISIVVPAFNEEKLIGETLERIRAAMGAFSNAGWSGELIVCDNNSSDRTGEIARNAGAIVVREPINQIGRARNTGAAAAKGDWLLFVDADSHPTRELFADLVEAIKDGRTLYGGCIVYMDDVHWAARFGAAIWNRVSRIWKFAAGSFFFCEAAAFRKLGGFNQELFASEEIDLSKRLKKLAKETGGRGVILTRHPMVTSGRKLKLYSIREHLTLFRRALFASKRTLTNRDECYLWYDGRR